MGIGEVSRPTVKFLVANKCADGPTIVTGPQKAEEMAPASFSADVRQTISNSHDFSKLTGKKDEKPYPLIELSTDLFTYRAGKGDPQNPRKGLKRAYIEDVWLALQCLKNAGYYNRSNFDQTCRNASSAPCNFCVIGRTLEKLGCATFARSVGWRAVQRGRGRYCAAPDAGNPR